MPKSSGMKSIAVMQPYIFPYIGYFQLISAVDRFIFYDDVNYINRGWINRNRILINNEAKYLTLPCKSASQNKLINEVKHALNDKLKCKILKKIKLAYHKAPYFKPVFTLIQHIMDCKSDYISDFAIDSVKKVTAYLALNCSFSKSSDNYNNFELKAADRLIDICKHEGIKNYINPIGGEKLYDKNYFKKHNINLFFLEASQIEYKQFTNDFVPSLSIIDAMMFNDPKKIKNDFLNRYKLI